MELKDAGMPLCSQGAFIQHWPCLELLPAQEILSERSMNAGSLVSSPCLDIDIRADGGDIGCYAACHSSEALQWSKGVSGDRLHWVMTEGSNHGFIMEWRVMDPLTWMRDMCYITYSTIGDIQCYEVIGTSWCSDLKVTVSQAKLCIMGNEVIEGSSTMSVFCVANPCWPEG